MSQFNKPIPSPFSPDPTYDEQFFKELDTLRRKFNMRQIFVAYSKPFEKGVDNWFAQANVISEGMVEYLTRCVEDISDHIDDEDDELSTDL